MPLTPFSAWELMQVMREGVRPPNLEARWKLTKRHYARKLSGALYRKSAAGKDARARYNRSAKHRQAAKRYRSSERGQQMVAALNDKRIYIGKDYRGRAKTVEHATAIHAHIKERLCELKQGFAHREKTKGAPSGKVSPEAAV